MTLLETYNSITEFVWCDKGNTHSYIEEYSKLFSPFKDKKINLLEVGVFEGGSLQLWHDYFLQGSITGFDIEGWDNRDDAVFEKICAQERVSFIHGDATSKEDLKKLGGKMFDIIIDDASHLEEDQQFTLENLYASVNPGGIYVIEDIKSLEIAKNLGNQFPNKTIVDLREHKERYDDILAVWRV